MFPMWFVPRFVITLPDTPFGMVCLFCGSLRHRARGPSERGFFSDLRSHLLVYSYRLRLLLLRRFGRAPFIQRPSTSTITCPYPPSCFSSSVTLTQSFFSSYSSRHLFSPPLPPENLTFQSSKGKEKKEKDSRIFPNKQLTELSAPSPGRSYFRQLLQHQQLLRNQISQNLLRTGM